MLCSTIYYWIEFTLLLELSQCGSNLIPVDAVKVTAKVPNNDKNCKKVGIGIHQDVLKGEL